MQAGEEVLAKKDKSEKKAKNRKREERAEVGEIGPLLVQAARSLRTVMSRNLAESGLYAGQDGVMLALSEEDGLTAGGLAARLGVKAPTMTRTIGRMEAQGFLARRADAQDARLTKVYLTETGRERLQGIAEAGRLTDEIAAKDLSDKQRRTLAKLLRAVDDNLQGRLDERER